MQEEIDENLLLDTLYNDQNIKQLYSINVTCTNSVSDKLVQAEWSQNDTKAYQNQEYHDMIKRESEKIAAFDPTQPSPPESLPAFQAKQWEPGEGGVDYRPHLINKATKECSLVDTGSVCTVYPPEPGDKIDPSIQLQAVNGEKMKCYGYKEIEVKMGRKSFPFRAVKADVSTPIIGWDFIKRYRLDFRWI